MKRIAFMLLRIDKCLMTIELRSKGRNPNITPRTITPWKKWRIILVVVCKGTFLEWVVCLLRFWNYGTIICAIFRGGWRLIKKIFKKIISPYLARMIRTTWPSGGMLQSSYLYERMAHRIIEIQVLCLWERRHIVFHGKWNDLGEYDIVISRPSLNRSGLVCSPQWMALCYE
jgi:hypothetical protein